jgi:hypothetical protein
VQSYHTRVIYTNIRSDQLQDSTDIPLPERVLDWIYSIIKHKKYQKYPLEILNKVGKKNIFHLKCCGLIASVNELYKELYSGPNGPVEVVKKLVSMCSTFSLDQLPFALSLPIREALYELADVPDELVNDIDACELLKRFDLASLNRQHPLYNSTNEKNISKFRFLNDDRIIEIHSLLSLEQEPFLDMNLTTDMSVEDIQLAQQRALQKYSQKYFTLSLGRALLYFESNSIVQTEVYKIPAVNCRARLPPLNASIQLNTTSNPEILDWPEFHAGVSAGLEIKSNCKDLTSSWIVFNQGKCDEGNKIIDPAHGGFILGLGLSGHLKKLESVDSLRNYFTQYEIVTVGHLLGLSFAYKGSGNINVSNMLIVHLPAMLPNQAIDLCPGYNLKAAAIFGYGLVHLESPTNYKYDKILSEIEKTTHSENAAENIGSDTYIISSGFSLVSFQLIFWV